MPEADVLGDAVLGKGALANLRELLLLLLCLGPWLAFLPFLATPFGLPFATEDDLAFGGFGSEAARVKP